MNWQSPFEVLISSAACKENDDSRTPIQSPLSSRFPVSSSKTSGSIDDFLADYRHERSSILLFLSCLEEPENKIDQSSDITIHSNSSYMVGTSSLRQPHDLAAPNGKGESGTTICTAGRNQSSTRAVPAIVTDESKEEQRRKRNREYQRRFRERKMRLDRTGLESNAAPPP